MKSILIVSHGSRSPKTKKEIEFLVHQIRLKSSIPIIEYAFLELETPSIPEGIKNCVDQGATDVNVLLNFLNSGRHVDEDIPVIVSKEQMKYNGVTFQISKPVGQHKSIADLFISMFN